MLDELKDGLVNVWAVVDEVSQTEFRTMEALVGAPAAEPEVILGDAGELVETVCHEPAPRLALHDGATLGDQPDSAAEGRGEPGDCLDCFWHLGRAKHGGFVTAEERRIASGLGRSGDDDPADVDTEPGLASAIPCHLWAAC